MHLAPGFGSIVAEVPAGKVGELSITYTVIGEVTEKDFSYGNVSISSDEALAAWKGTLEKVFPTVAVKDTTKVETPSTKQTASMYAVIKWQDRRYLFRYSQVPTASTTAQRHLSVPVQML